MQKRYAALRPLALIACALASAVHAQTLNDPTPILGNNVVESARAAANAAAFTPNKGGARISAQEQAEKDQVQQLIKALSNCKSQATVNGSNRRAHRTQCETQYLPQFKAACVGGASTIAICTRLKRTGSIAN